MRLELMDDADIEQYGKKIPQQQFSVNDIEIFKKHEKRDILFFVINYNRTELNNITEVTKN